MVSLFSNKKAMTLPEIIITVMLVSVVIGAGIMPFVMQQKMLKAHMARSDIQDQLSIAMAYFNRDIFRAEEIIGISVNSITLGIGTNLVPGADENITYTLVGTDLKRDDSINNIIVANNIQTINFSVSGNNIVKVDITASDADHTQSLSSSAAFALRATSAI
jgi:prepilin-type N-terminal cleavage/methylation domain-containing protein